MYFLFSSMVSSALITLVFAEDITKDGTLLLRGPLGSGKVGFLLQRLKKLKQHHAHINFYQQKYSKD